VILTSHIHRTEDTSKPKDLKAYNAKKRKCYSNTKARPLLQLEIKHRIDQKWMNTAEPVDLSKIPGKCKRKTPKAY
jgi:hypothetical protein